MFPYRSVYVVAEPHAEKWRYRISHLYTTHLPSQGLDARCIRFLLVSSTTCRDVQGFNLSGNTSECSHNADNSGGGDGIFRLCWINDECTQGGCTSTSNGIKFPEFLSGILYSEDRKGPWLLQLCQCSTLRLVAKSALPWNSHNRLGKSSCQPGISSAPDYLNPYPIIPQCGAPVLVQQQLYVTLH